MIVTLPIRYPVKVWIASLWEIVFIAGAYGIISRALDTGSWWQYGLGAVLIYASVRGLVYLIRRMA